MTLAITHTAVAAGTDAGTGEIHKAEWNAAHTTSMATGFFLGRLTASTGVIEEIALTAAGAALLDDAAASNQRTTLGLVAVASSGSAADLSTGTLPDARLSSAATAFGAQGIPIPAGAMTAATTNGPSSGSVAVATSLIQLVTLDFDTTTSEIAWFSVIMPLSWNEGTVTFQPVFSQLTTAAGAVVFELSAVAVSDGDVLTTAAGTGQTSTKTAGTANTQYTGPASAAITIAGTPAAGDTVYFCIKRLPADGGDTLAQDARLHGIRLILTTDAGHD